MSRILTGRGTSLAWGTATPSLPSGVSSPIVDIQSYEFNDNEEFETFLDSLARVNSHYKAVRESSLTIQTSDINVAQILPLGTAFETATMVVEAAIESTGVATNGNFTIGLGRVVLTERSVLEHDNTHSAPSTVQLTFTLSRGAAANADPTVTKSVGSVGS